MPYPPGIYSTHHWDLLSNSQQPLLPGSEYATRGLGLLFLLNFVSVITAVFILEAKEKDVRKDSEGLFFLGGVA